VCRWHDALLGYMGNDPARRDGAERSMAAQGRAAGINFDYNVLAQWQPVESQRLLLWAGRYGLQEDFITAMNKRHFEQAQSASSRDTLMAAAEEVGLDVAAATAFLDTDELEDYVWHWYGATINEKGIHSIPLFCFNVPTLGAVGGPFRNNFLDPDEKTAGRGQAVGQAKQPFVVRGSMDSDYFLELFEVILRDITAGARVLDQRAAKFNNPFNDAERKQQTQGGGECSA
jgi:predicted DsbA family dithiol-disulfide isomerase